MSDVWSGWFGDRRGVTVVEAVVALVLSALVVQLSLRAHAVLRGAGAHHEEVRGRLGDLRHARVVLSAELEGGGAEDWSAFPPDSILLRAFRVTAFPCEPIGDSTTYVVTRLAGRTPDPTKDSAKVLDEEGTWHAVDLEHVGRAPASCPDSVGPVDLWRLSRPVDDAVLFRLFESGSYHMVDALRYRRGRSGRQPLTGNGTAGYGFSGGEHRLDLVGVEADVPLPVARRRR